MKRKLISVIVPIYNAEKYLDRCLESIVNQSYSNLEILLIDDGSFDKSYRLCMEWGEKDKRVRVIGQENQGVSKARNTGIYNATGEYISFIDADDFVDISYIETLLKSIIENDSDMAFCGICRWDNGKKTRTDEIIPKEYLREENNLFECYYRHFFRINGANYMGAYSVRALYKMSMIVEHGLYFPECKRSEDMIFLISVLNHVQKVSSVKESLYYYCMNTGSATKQIYIENALQDRIVYLSYLKKFIGEATISLENKKEIIYSAILSNKVSLILNALNSERASIRKKEIENIQKSEFNGNSIPIGSKWRYFKGQKFKQKILSGIIFLKFYPLLRVGRKFIK